MTFSRIISPAALALLLIVMFRWMPNANAQCNEYAHVNSSVTENGDCMCGVTSSLSSSCGSGVSSEEFQQMIRDLDQQIVDINVELKTLRVTLNQQGEDIVAMNEQMENINAIEKRIIDNEIVISRPEYDIIRTDLQDMETLIGYLEDQNADQYILDQLQEEIANISYNLDSLETNNDADVETLLRDIADLQQKIAECEAGNDPESDIGFPYPWEDFEKQDSCGTIKGLSEPYTLRGNLASTGVWFMDPMVDVDRPWYQVGITYTSSILRYLSTEQFQTQGIHETYLPGYTLEGCSVVAYNGALFYNKYSSTTMIRYDYRAGAVTNQRALPNAGYKTNYVYLSGGYTSIDFAVDEKGLWVIYGKSSDSGLMSVSKIDPLTLEVEETYNTNSLKANFGECFMVCGKLYCTDSFNKHDGRIVMMYDTTTQTTTTLNVPFDSKYLATRALKYNPRDQRLYAFNNGHALAYEIEFQVDE
ncbi:amassin-3 precursor [Strongylocentrotus purpuratus]|uniref:Amassin-3 n=1 Tax=Strongylocentrotus purpuratus TaxID=7668 RepID=Q1PS63_STRPU|nr:amassin-3 precursor [Strongylocentrotus purpuratus]ABB77239.1 amassin-3 [Strongylocentrotus purpuratus]|eukprot:NP_001073012.1 amassin-3 precursor [Strongylocentrotus purpuratus]